MEVVGIWLSRTILHLTQARGGWSRCGARVKWKMRGVCLNQKTLGKLVFRNMQKARAQSGLHAREIFGKLRENRVMN